MVVLLVHTRINISSYNSSFQPLLHSGVISSLFVVILFHCTIYKITFFTLTKLVLNGAKIICPYFIVTENNPSNMFFIVFMIYFFKSFEINTPFLSSKIIIILS